MADNKREADFKDEDLVAKKNKVADVDTGNLGKGKKEQNLAIDAVDGNLIVSALSKGQNGSNEEKLSAGMINWITGFNEASNDAASCNSEEVQDQIVEDLCTIDAAAAEDKGSRHTMEDAWVVLPDASLEYPGNSRCAHFAIYDGHGGILAAEHAQKHLHANVLIAGLPRELIDVKAAKRAILKGFRRTDESLLQESIKGNWQDGATAVCVWVLGQTVLIANIGDAKAVLARATTSEGTQNPLDDTGLKAIVLTREHKAIYSQERARIQKAGGTVSANGRLQGRIEVSRAFGDRQFKKVGVIATPDVHSFELTKREHFIILGCDGLWGVFGPSDAVEFVQKQLKETSSAAAAARRLVREAIRERRCKDNCTAIVIVFKHK